MSAKIRGTEQAWHTATQHYSRETAYGLREQMLCSFSSHHNP